jgi:Transposase domain (DUF772)
MTLGLAERQGNLFDDVERFCDETLDERSIYVFLHRERERLFPDEAFADLFEDRGRRSVAPSVVATVMVLQRLEGLSDREAVERFCFDSRWRYAAGVGGYDTGGPKSFVHTVLVDMRERLRKSENPDRIFEAAFSAAKAAGLLGKRRVLDSTPLYDAVATMDTVTLIRSAIRGLLKVADVELATSLRAAMTSGDDYATAAKPQIDWDDSEARETLVDALARDAYACLLVLEGETLDEPVARAAELLATVTGQDIEHCDDETFRIARKVAKDRVICVSRSCDELAGGSPVTVMTKQPCSWWAMEGETRLLKPHDKVADLGGKQACGPYDEESCGSAVRSPAKAGESGSRAPRLRAKAMEGAKILVVQHRGTRRRSGIGTYAQFTMERERSVSAPASRPQVASFGRSGKWRNL